jgi:putative transposase
VDNARLVSKPSARLYSDRPRGRWPPPDVHYARNLATKVRMSAEPWVLTLPRTVFDQPDADQVAAQFTRVGELLQARFPATAEHLAAAEADLLAFTGFPREVWWRAGPWPPAACCAALVV